jgi:hypothetical protein
VAPTQIKIPRGAVPGTVLEYPSDGGERLRVSSYLCCAFGARAPNSLGGPLGALRCSLLRVTWGRPLRWWCRTGSSPATLSRSGRGDA